MGTDMKMTAPGCGAEIQYRTSHSFKGGRSALPYPCAEEH